MANDAGRTVDPTVAMASLSAQPFALEVQLEARDGSVRILDTTAGGTGNANLTQIRDPQNPEAPGPAVGADRLWDGFTGAGYLDMGLNAGDAFAFDVTAPAVGTYRVTLRYANGGAADRPLALTVDGVELARIPFAPTSGWSSWGEVSVDVPLKAGLNTIKVAIPGDVSPFTGPNLDSAVVTALDPVDPGVEPGPREVVRINFQDGAAPKAPGHLVDNYQGFGDRGNGERYGWVTEASALDADGTRATPINGAAFPAVAVNERTGAGTLPADGSLPPDQLAVNFGAYDPRLTGYAHFDLNASFPSRTAWEIALENGWYEVTVAVGDPGGPNDSINRLYVEGTLAAGFTPTSAHKVEVVTALAKVTDGHLTLSAQGGTITEMGYLEIRALPDLTPGDAREAPEDYAFFRNPVAISADGREVALDRAPGARTDGIDPTSDISIGIDVVDGRGGVLLASTRDGSVRLYETLTGLEVPYNTNSSAGFDTLSIAPAADLKPFTSYTLAIDGVQDRGDISDPAAPTREFQKFSTTFTTGAAPVVEARQVAFAPTVEVVSNPALGESYTSIEMSPNRAFVYVTSMAGTITRWAVDTRTGAILDATKEVFAPQGDFNVPEAADNPRRGIIGIAFDPEDPNTIWVTDNYPIPLNGRSNSVPDFSGRISKVTLGEGGSLANATIETFATGLPRSNGDHVTNSLEFRANPDAGKPGEPAFLLYLTQGSNTAMGGTDSAWGLRPERLLNAAILEVDRTKTPPAGGFDLATEPLPADGLYRRFADADGNPKNGPIAITSGPWQGNSLVFAENGSATVRDAAGQVLKAFYDPFAPDAPVRIFAEGARNAYDLVWHSNGYLYVPGNGSAAGGNVPDDPATPANEAGTNFDVQSDYLFRMAEGRYYGHPNTLRGDFVLNGGNPTAGVDPNEVGNYPVGTLPEPDYDLAGSHPLGISRSPNGVVEYASAAFGASLQNAVIFTQYSTGDNLRAVTLNADGTVASDFVLRNPAGQVISYVDPLDVIEGLDGRLYMLTLNRATGTSQIVRLEAAPGGVVPDQTADVGDDLALVVIDARNPASVTFQVEGLDVDVQTITVSIDGGPAQAVTLDADSRFTRNLSGKTGTVPAVLSVADASGNTATDTAIVNFAAAPPPPKTIDATAFTRLDLDGGTIIRRIDAPGTYETDRTNDKNRDGLNDGYDGLGYLDPNGGPEDKASFTYTAAAAGDHTLTFRMAANSDRPIAIQTGSQSVAIAATNTGSFTTWKDFPVTLRLAAGANTIVIEQTGASAPNIDSVTVAPVAPGTPAPDRTADEGGDLALSVVSGSNPAAVVFQVAGLDADIQAITVSFDNGATSQPVTLSGGRFTANLSGRTGPVTATLKVADEVPNTATASASFTLAGAGTPDIKVQSLDPAYFDDRLHFSWIDNPSAVVPGTPRDYKESATVRITNGGTGPLAVEEATVAGPFKLANPAALQGLTLAAGASIDVGVLFNRAAYTARADNVSGVADGTLTLRTNDPDAALTKINLSVFRQARDEGGQEPNINEVWDVFGFGNRIEGLSLAKGGENSVLNFFDLFLPSDETEVLSPLWRLADGVTTARITQIAAFHSPDTAAIAIHAPGDKNAQVALTTHANVQNQTFLPLLANGAFATNTITGAKIPDAWTGNDVFGIKVAGLSTDPNLNPTGAGAPTQAQLNARYPGYTVSGDQVYDPAGNPIPDGHVVRMYQAVDDNGAVIPNVYLGVQDYTGLNYDYNDNMFIIEGVAPVTPPAQAPIQSAFPGPSAPTLAASGTLTVDASNYDDGGQGVAYNDQAGLQGGTNGGRAGSSVEQTADGDVGWVAAGEWLEYTVNVAQAGTYDVGVLLATNGGAGRSVKVDFYRPGDASPYETSGPIANPVTGSWTNFLTRSAEGIDLAAGVQVVRVTLSGGAQNFRSFTLEPADAAPAARMAAGPDAGAFLAAAVRVPDELVFSRLPEGGESGADDAQPSLGRGARGSDAGAARAGAQSHDDAADLDFLLANATSIGQEDALL